MQSTFLNFAQMPVGYHNASAVIAACRAGGVGVINAEFEADPRRIVAQMVEVAAHVQTSFGVRVGSLSEDRDQSLVEGLKRFAGQGLCWLFVDYARIEEHASLIADLRQRGVAVLAQVTSADGLDGGVELAEEHVDGIVLKGHEAGGFVGEDSTFVLVQKWLGATELPLFVHGGLTPQVAAACSALGVAGGVFDSQLLLLEDMQAPRVHESTFGKLAGSETVAVGDGERGQYFRVLVRPGHEVARAFAAEGKGKGFEALADAVVGRVRWDEPRAGLLAVGQDICFAAPWREQYKSIAGVFRAVRAAVHGSLRTAVDAQVIRADAPLARALKTPLPIVQGPMTRVSDRPEFAAAVAEAGALPMLALALLKGESLRTLLNDTAAMLGDRPWGVGLLGFAPQTLLDEQLAAALEAGPDYAIIAGGRPDQAVQLEEAGIPSFLHVPSAALIGPFLRGGSRRFIFEGRECGGHIGPLSSFVLWSTMVTTLVTELEHASSVHPSEIQVLFAGGIHDAVSSAMVQVLAAPLVAKGINVGILMGSAYLFTQQIVERGAIVPRFQQVVVECERTVALASGPGHASRCALTPFAEEFFRTRERLDAQGVPADEGRQVLDDLILGRLRIASKGVERQGRGGELQALDEGAQHDRGMYMLGQVATLRSKVVDMAALHAEVSDGAAQLLRSRLREQQEATADEPRGAADIAIVGMSCLFPGASSPDEYWDNILGNVDAITEIPAHRWDWRLYFDADPKAKDRIYSKWGGFLDDLVFDPTKYGIPPRSLKSIDPMQLIALEVATRTLADAGYDNGSYDRSRASVIIGSSGGTGDVGTQYCVRSELPRYLGELPEHVADQLPEWTEDSFPGILANVIAGRVAKRLNFGGVNFTTDAACASSLAALYQGVNELVAGRSDLVLAGAVDTVQGPFGYLCFSKTQALSARGRCSSFAASSDGIVISEGVAMVALKRLADAQRDGDRIYAVIKGVGGSSDGSSRGLTAPVPAGQLQAMRRAYEAAGFGAQSVGLFEAHGTGTVAGDIAELKSTSELIRRSGGRPQHSVIGSVKTTIGHTKSTAGMAGLIKVAMALHRRVLPPHFGVEEPNPVLQCGRSPLYLIDQARPWLGEAGKARRGAVSAFGFGGTNFHAVLEEYTGEYRPWLQPTVMRKWPAELLVWRAADVDGLVASLTRLQEAMSGDADVVLRDLAAGLARDLGTGSETLAIVARDAGALLATLPQVIAVLRGDADQLPRGVYRGSAPAGDQGGKVAVVFSGQGSQYPEMLRELMVHFDACAQTLATADELLRDRFTERFGEGRTLSRFVFPRGSYTDDAKAAAAQALTSTDVAQPALGAVDAAAYHLMQHLGLRPDMVGGHSFGEFVALYAGGVIDFDLMLSLAAERGRAIVDASEASGVELGTMAAVRAEREVVEAAIADVEGVIVANHNAPKQVVLSGTRDGIAEATRRLDEAGARVTELPVAAGFHSAQVRPAQPGLSEAIAGGTWSAPTIPVYSNTTAEPHADDVATLKRVMAEHLVEPVEFVAQVEAMYRDGARTFVELGPKSVLSNLVGRILGDRAHVAVSIDRVRGLEGLLGALAQMLCAGIDLELVNLFTNRANALPDPYALPAKPVPSKLAWLVNGSGVRPVGAPAKPVGVTLEQASAKASTATSPAPALAQPVAAVPAQPVTAVPAQPVAAVPAQPVAAVPAQPVAAAPPPPAIAVVPVAPKVPSLAPPAGPPAPAFSAAPARFCANRRSKASSMTDHDHGTLNGYFSMMRTFLETQERVMSTYLRTSARTLDGDVAPRSRLPPERVLPLGPTPVAPPAVAPRVHAVPAPSAPMAAPMAAPVPVTVAAPVPVPAAPVAVAPPQAPVAAPQPAAAPVATTSIAVAPPQAPAAAPTGGSEAPNLAKMTEMLLGIVEDKTGYPRDMVSLTQNLEADLGIDSIKRVEVSSAMLEVLPEAHRKVLTARLGELSKQPTLEGMLTILGSINGKNGESVPFDLPEAGPVADVGHPPRYVVVGRRQPIARGANRRLRQGHFIVADDNLGLAEDLAQHLVNEGCTVSRVPHQTLADEAALLEWIAAHAPASVSGIVHLAGVGGQPIDPDAPVDTWRRALMLHEKSLFVLLHGLHAVLADDGHVLAASGLGGSFGRDAHEGTEGLHLQGGAVGLLKSFFEERPGLRVKAVDVDPSLASSSIAVSLMGELSLVGGRQEVGYPKGQRTTFHTVPMAVSTTPPTDSASTLNSERVVLATGGGRGVTAEVLRELAAPGTTLVLTGRRTAPQAEPPDMAAATTAAGLRNRLIAQVRSGRSRMTFAQIGREVQATLAARELRQNIEDFERRGATVEYHAVDVTDEASLRALVSDVKARLGGVHGVVHGAGIIEDKLLVDKTSESWSRVVETKVLGLLLLHKLVEPDNLEFFAVMSSVAGRYGNSGQIDYATANELMNRLCCQLRDRWQQRVNVMALCWGPWGPTQFGQGMVNAGIEAKFAEKGVFLVTAAAGRKLFGDEVRRTTSDDVELIFGAGPWEEHEAAVGAIEGDPQSDPQSADADAARGPLLGDVEVSVRPDGGRVLSVRLDANHTYLAAHRIDGVAILPAAAAVELFAEAGQALWPGWHVVEVRECRMLKGVDLQQPERCLELELSLPSYGSSEGFEVSASLRSPGASGQPPRIHYRCVLRFAQQYPESFSMTPQAHTERTLTVEEAYGRCLFHGPCFQVIERLDGLSSAGAQALVRASSPAQWLNNAKEAEAWIFDPALVDAGPQMAILWARSFHDQTVLPTGFGRVVRYGAALPSRLRMVFERLPTKIPQQVRASVYYLDDDDNVVLFIEDLCSIGSSALNRIATRTTVETQVLLGSL